MSNANIWFPYFELDLPNQIFSGGNACFSVARIVQVSKSQRIKSLFKNEVCFCKRNIKESCQFRIDHFLKCPTIELLSLEHILRTSDPGVLGTTKLSQGGQKKTKEYIACVCLLGMLFGGFGKVLWRLLGGCLGGVWDMSGWSLRGVWERERERERVWEMVLEVKKPIRNL